MDGNEPARLCRALRERIEQNRRETFGTAHAGLFHQESVALAVHPIMARRQGRRAAGAQPRGALLDQGRGAGRVSWPPVFRRAD